MSKTERESIKRASGGGNTPTDYDAANNVKPTSDSIENYYQDQRTNRYNYE